MGITDPSVGVTTYGQYLDDLKAKYDNYLRNDFAPNFGLGEARINYDANFIQPLQIAIDRVQKTIDTSGPNTPINPTPTTTKDLGSLLKPNLASLGIPTLIIIGGLTYLILRKR